jgi:hypothetical protein
MSGLSKVEMSASWMAGGHGNGVYRLEPARTGATEGAARGKAKAFDAGPIISRAVRVLIHKMCRENPLWGAPRIHGELLKLGIDVAESSISKYMLRRHRPPSQTWRTFLENHVRQLVSVDFFTVVSRQNVAHL